ncbi:hypothetical protein [Flavobacterium ginsengiterrae]|uniref:Uncharacterized protein n=1 Tax=Flavobacterium ginsengiterrae TaxID=871695 RepID=A0ABP7GST2_9FLAO
MINNLPKLDFLYINLERTEENYLNRIKIYYDKVDWDERHFEDYAETCSFEELIFLMIHIYTDKYPRNEFEYIISLDSKEQILSCYTNQNGRIVTENKFIYNNFLRKEVIGMNSWYHHEQYTDDEIIEKYWSGEYYMQNLFLEFNRDIPIDIIHKALDGKEYTKTKDLDTLIYKVKDSPIDTLRITKTSIQLNINEEKVILYVSIR